MLNLIQITGAAASVILAFTALLSVGADVRAQQLPEGWDGGVATEPARPGAPQGAAPAGQDNTTIIPRAAPDAAPPAEPGIGQIRLVALLTSDGQRIDQGIIWRVFQEKGGDDGKAKLVSTHRDASPVLKLKPGDYLVNAALGRAHLTRKIVISSDNQAPTVEKFVLNAGGLRVAAQVSGAEAAPNSVTYAIYSDRDQSDNRRLIMGSAKPGLIIRLNAGIYHIVSTFGDANAVVRSDVTVEAGKLTEATVAHAAAKATFKLVARAGSEALADTQWTIQTPQGDVVKESTGALPTHYLAPGTYTAIAESQGKAFRREFSLKDGDTTQIEVLIE